MPEKALLEFPFASPVPLELPAEYARLRAQQPVAAVILPTGDRAWLATRYAEVRQVYLDPRFSRAAAVRLGAPRCNQVGPDPESIVSKDPPEHTRLRRLVAPAFAARRIEAMRPRIMRLVEGLLDEMADAGPPVDLVDRLAFPVPIAVICELLGVPETDRNRFRDWSEVFMSTTAHSPEAVRAAQARFESYLSELVADKRRHPTEDLLSILIAARDTHDRLTEQELINLGVTILVTGFETTATQIANFVVTLLHHPDQLARLRSDPDLICHAVEELLRYVPRRTDGGAIRVALEDVQLGGVTIRAGEAVIPAIGSANRDGTQFPDADRLDVTRSDTSNLAFGFGSHHCLGAQLARAEMQIVFGALLRRFPGLRLAVPESDLSWRTGTLVPTPISLLVTW